MRHLVLSGLLAVTIFNTAAYATDADTSSLPRISIVSEESSQKTVTTQVTQVPAPAKSADSALNDFYGRGKGQGKGSKVPPQGKEKPTPPPVQDVYGEVPLPPTSKDDEFGGQVAMPEIVQKAVMSRSDVNRIICPEPVKDVIFSEEKGVMSKFYGNSAYIKFNFDQVGENPVYSKNPVELHIICGATTYTLVAVPLPVPPQVIRLGSDKVVKARENASIFKDSDTNKQIREILRRAYKDELPDSFTTKKSSIPIYLFRDLDIVLARTTTVEGEGITVKEFIVTSKVNGLELKEKQFLRRELSANPAAIAMEPGKQKPAKGEPVRLFIVEFKAANSPEGAANVE